MQNNIDDRMAVVGVHMKPRSLPDAEHRSIVLLVKFLRCTSAFTHATGTQQQTRSWLTAMRCSRVSPLNPGGCCVLSKKWGFKLKGSSAMASKEEG